MSKDCKNIKEGTIYNESGVLVTFEQQRVSELWKFLKNIESSSMTDVIVIPDINEADII